MNIYSELEYMKTTMQTLLNRIEKLQENQREQYPAVFFIQNAEYNKIEKYLEDGMDPIWFNDPDISHKLIISVLRNPDKTDDFCSFMTRMVNKYKIHTHVPLKNEISYIHTALMVGLPNVATCLYNLGFNMDNSIPDSYISLYGNFIGYLECCYDHNPDKKACLQLAKEWVKNG